MRGKSRAQILPLAYDRPEPSEPWIAPPRLPARGPDSRRPAPMLAEGDELPHIGPTPGPMGKEKSGSGREEYSRTWI